MDRGAHIGIRIWGFALILGAVLAALWLRSDWAALSHGRLPDNDDMARLSQVRDWLSGQSFTDLVQHRLGAHDSGSMHWSRLGDLGIAGWVLILRPLLGAAQADIWAAILWPPTLFILYLGLSARLATRLAGRDHAVTALLVAAFAFPAITMFVPGRIDHHGLQIVLVLALVEAVLRPPEWRSGALIGALIAASLAIGLETAPQCVVAMAALFILWVRDGMAERARIAAMAIALGGLTLGWMLAARPAIWSPLWCDGFTPASTDATYLATGYWLLIAAATPRVRDWRTRLGVGAIGGIVVLAVVYQTSSVCLSGPYGATDPLLRRLWMDRIVEAEGLFAQGNAAIPIAFGALPIIATLATAWCAATTRGARWMVQLGFIAMALLVTLFQVRGAAMAAALASPALAVMIQHARAAANRPGGALRLIAAWLGSAGLFWSIAGHAAGGAGSPGKPLPKGAACTDAETIEQLRTLPTSTIIAPMDVGAYIIGMTPHRVLAAPYHRNNLGNRAAYDFWLSRPDEARVIANAWHADYVLACPNAFGGIDLNVEGPGGMAQRLEAGKALDWLVPVPLKASQGHLYRVLPAPPSHR